MSVVDVLESTIHTSSDLRRQRARSYLEWRLKEECSRWEIAHTNSSFSRRVTSLRWHPVHPQTVAYGTHSGDILLWDYTKAGSECPKIEGIGMGDGCITEMRFHPLNTDLIYATNVEGKFCLHDFEGRHSEVCLDTMTLDYWWCAMDYSVDHGVLLVGDNRGSAVLMDMTNHKTIEKVDRLHKGKIKHIEFCPVRNWMVVTSSVDRTIKFWDIRMLRSGLSSRPVPISSAGHTGLVSSAYFDPMHGTRLLTTAQDGEIRVYDSHDLWEKPTCVVKHTHRNFQHMTDIKATWHPTLRDVCVVGRYPGKNDPDKTRTVDLIDLKVGAVCGQFHSPHVSGIIQLNQFSKCGECLASGMGYNGLIWKPPPLGVGVGGVATALEGQVDAHRTLFGSEHKKKRHSSQHAKDKGVPKKKIRMVVKDCVKTCKRN